VWYSFLSGFTSSFTTSVAKRPALCPTSLKTLSHRVKHMVKLQKHSSSLPMKLLMKLFSKKTTSLVKLSCAKQGSTLCPTLWSASLKTHSHRVKHMVKLKNMALSPAHEVAHRIVFKKQLYR
jgi:hypothetical protein